jgi:ribosomal protein L4
MRITVMVGLVTNAFACFSPSRRQPKMPKAAAEKGSKKETKPKGAKKAKVGPSSAPISQHGRMGGVLVLVMHTPGAL